MSKCVLVTGGAGYIGSHTVLALLENGNEVIVIDNFSNSSPKSIDGIERICGKRPTLIQADVRDSLALESAFTNHDIAAVFHFAGLKSVEESVQNPELYYDENIGAALNVIDQMRIADVKTLIFSSSATVYEPSEAPPYAEDSLTGPKNPYGQTKLLIEQILTDLAGMNPEWRIGLLRYFNPVGAHSSGSIGEAPSGEPNNLMPLLMQVGVGKVEKLSIFGNDYETPDGTCVRDFIHVVDLARGHIAALRFLENANGAHIWNLGTGVGTSVMELIQRVESATGMTIPTEVVSRRQGDSPIALANPSKAFNDLNWRPEYSIENMCIDHWNWQCLHPDGY
ncbi:MAG: UDP-glucose 4-epimerase GalE [Acidimicrobiales bacterium]|jgi:UDP-glucose 4-epimerase|nr:UDP-glucose 4-epimerase GalE [Acidimicrobiales bacterium]HJM28975.1 UDP-glucose 4-epimerase GalE [Acidimicrobiales bacterium]HJM97064.1 UDP-glucose 4-epimerase GalE [Acidimicrobiales bacterium]